jgi:hypothetical protein
MSEPKETGPEQAETNAERTVVVPPALGELATDLRRLIEATRARVAQTVNAEFVMLNWQIGNRIHRDILVEARAGYG